MNKTVLLSYAAAANLRAYGRHGGKSDMNVTSPANNSDLSLKTGSGSPSASLSDTDSDLFNSINGIVLLRWVLCMLQ